MSEHDVAEELADILSWNREDVFQEVTAEAAHPGSHVRDAWLAAAPKTDEQIESFYTSTTSYIFDLMVESARDVRVQWRKAVAATLDRFWGSGGANRSRVLDYGAGVGTDTLYFAEHCRAAYYYDLPGPTSEFAAKRFVRHGVPITRVTTTSTYNSEFDAVVSFEVLEHVIDPLMHLDEMVRLTKPGGMLFLTESFGLIGDDYPSHLPQHSHLSTYGKLDELMSERGCRAVEMLEGRIHVYVKGPAVTVIVPVYNAFDHVSLLLESIRRTVPGYPVRWMLVNDASPDTRLSPLLRGFAAEFAGSCQVIESVENRGFVQTCNHAIADAGQDDVILLNSDTILYDGWVLALLQAAYEDPAIGTATPLSNNASAYTMFHHVSPANDLNEMLIDTEQGTLEIPVGVGFCLYIKRELLDRVGMFDPIFGKGYGEETDLCLRAAAAGYRHVLATRAFVYHAGSASMVSASVVRKGETTVEAHERIVVNRYPHFSSSVHQFIGSGVIEAMTHDLNKRYVLRETSRRPSVAIVVHDDVFAKVVGGTTYHIRDLMRELEHEFVFFIITPEGPRVRITAYVDGITYTLVQPTHDYAQMLSALNPSLIHIHHLMNFPSAFINALIHWAGQKIYTIHDYFGVCPQYTLVNYRQVYCGVPEPEECGRCAKALFGGGYDVPASQRRVFQRLVDSVTTVLAPSHAALDVFCKAISVPKDKTRVIPHPTVAHKYAAATWHRFAPQPATLPASSVQSSSAKKTYNKDHGGKRINEDADWMAKARKQENSKAESILNGAHLRVGFIGYNSSHKGTALFQGIVTACAYDPIAFVALGDIGKSVVGRKNLITTGQYIREDAVRLIKQYRLDVIVVASSWPETFGYTVSESWTAGIPILVGPMGAPAERVRECGAGLVVPDYTVQSFVNVLRGLLRDQSELSRIKAAALAVTMRQDYDEYRELYHAHLHDHRPCATQLFSFETIPNSAIGDGASVNQVPVFAKLVEARKRVFPVGSTRERVYFWLHNRVSRSYAGGIQR